MLNLLLVPGLSMIAGGALYPNQNFNPVAAGILAEFTVSELVQEWVPFYYGFQSLESFRLQFSIKLLEDTTKNAISAR
jgi:Ca2+/H+ antiporter